MLDSPASGSAFAGGRQADVFALSVDASVCSRAFLVDLTADFEAGDQRIAGQSFGTSADRFAVDNSTDGIGSAIARTFANAVATSFIGRAFVISSTAGNLAGRFASHCGDATAVGVGETVGRTLTDDGAQRSAVDNAAELSSISARINTARIGTFVVDTDLFAGTVGIRSTFRTRWTGSDDRGI